MSNLKTVMHPTSREIVTIDVDKEPQWQSTYLHRSGMPFETGMQMVAASEDVVEATDSKVIEESTDEVEVTIEELQAMYEEKLGKKAPAAYKNNMEWLINKING